MESSVDLNFFQIFLHVGFYSARIVSEDTPSLKTSQAYEKNNENHVSTLRWEWPSDCRLKNKLAVGREDSERNFARALTLETARDGFS